jgi:hypothetical protein
VRVVDATELEVSQLRDYGTQLPEWHRGSFESRDLARHAWLRRVRRAAIRSRVRYVSPLTRDALPGPQHCLAPTLTIPLSRPRSGIAVHFARPAIPLSCPHMPACSSLLLVVFMFSMVCALSSFPDRDPRMREILGGRKMVPEVDAITEASRLDGKRK